MTDGKRLTLLALNRPWYWPSEVAIMCNVSHMTVYRWIEAGKIKPFLKVRPFKIPAEELKKIL